MSDIDPPRTPTEVLRGLRNDAQSVNVDPSKLNLFEKRMTLYIRRFFGDGSNYEKDFDRIAFTPQRIRDVYNPYDNDPHENAQHLQKGIKKTTDLIDVMIEDLETRDHFLPGDSHARKEKQRHSRVSPPIVQHFHAPVAAVQHGDMNTANVVQHIGSDVTQIVSALKRLQEAAVAQGDSVAAVTVIADQAVSEIKSSGMTRKAVGLLQGLPGIVALAANLKPAYDAVRLAAKGAGLDLPELPS
jgi:hypothetical protein